MQIVISVAGAVVGGVIGWFAGGGPTGAAYGAEIGFALGGIASTLLVHQRSPTPGDLRVQGSSYGTSIPILYGLFRAAGNLIWAGQPSQSGGGGGGKGGMGKGGSGQIKVSMSFAVGLCEGPILGVRRVWANGKLIYDISNPSDFQAISGSSQMTTNFQVYLGNETQLPDPLMEAELGVGNVPPNRGLAYVVFNNLDLSTWGNYLPNLSFEVLANGTKTYAVSGSEAATVHPVFVANPLTLETVVTQLNANGASGFQFAFVGTTVTMVAFQTTAAGTTFLGAPFNTGYGYGIWRCRSYDELGILDAKGVWSTVTGPAIQTGMMDGASPNYQTVIKYNNRIFMTAGDQAHPIHVYANGSYADGDTAAKWVLVGVTNSFIYAVGCDQTDPIWGGWLCRFDLNGNFIAALAQCIYANVFTTGYAVSDSEIYIHAYDGNANGIMRWTGSALIDTGIPLDYYANMSQLLVIGSTAYYGCYSNVGAPSGVGNNFYANVPVLNGGQNPLSGMVADICARAGLAPSQYDVSALTDNVVGYGITNHTNARGNLAPLMATYFFDTCDTDGKIKFIRRGSQSQGVIAYGDLGASSSVGDTANQTPITEVIAQEVDLPRTVSLTYMAPNNDYLPNTQRAFRTVTRSVQEVQLNTPLVLPDDEGLLRAQAVLWAAWVGRKSFSFTTRLGYLAYEPGDVLTLNGATGQTYTIRIQRCQYDGQGSLLWTAQQEQPDIYPGSIQANGSVATAQGGQANGFTPQTFPYSGQTVLAVLDVPPLQDTDSAQGLYLAACGLNSTWPGCVVDVSRDGTSYSDLAQMTGASAIGFSASVLPSFFGGNQPDELNTVAISLYGGTLSSVSYANFLAGFNAAYLGGELILFRTATQTGANAYTLSGLLRGRIGTEWAMSMHTVGETFVLLNASVLDSVGINVHDIGTEMYFEPHLLNLFMNQPALPVTLTPSVARVKPLSPVLFTAIHGSVASLSDIALSWIRRARVHGQWISGTDVPLDESSESYQLQVLNAGIIVRTLVATGPAYTYTAAQIAADGFTTGNTINFNVAQNSDQGVLGYAATSTITR